MEGSGQGLCSITLPGAGQMMMMWAPSRISVYGDIVSSGRCYLAPPLQTVSSDERLT